MTASLKLYELGDMRVVLDLEIARAEGELTPELEEMLDSWPILFNEKVEKVALFIREQLAHADAIKAEKDRLDGMERACRKTAESLKAYLKAQMERAGVPKVKGMLVTVAIQDSPPSVRSTVPSYDLGLEQYSAIVTHVPETFKLDARAVIEAYKAGARLPEGITVEIGKHVRIR